MVLKNKFSAYRHYIKYPLCKVLKPSIEHLILDRMTISSLQAYKVFDIPGIRFFPECETPSHFIKKVDIIMNDIKPKINVVVDRFLDK